MQRQLFLFFAKKSTTCCQLNESGKKNPCLQYVMFDLVSYLSAASLKS